MPSLTNRLQLLAPPYAEKRPTVPRGYPFTHDALLDWRTEARVMTQHRQDVPLDMRIGDIVCVGMPFANEGFSNKRDPFLLDSILTSLAIVRTPLRDLCRLWPMDLRYGHDALHPQGFPTTGPSVLAWSFIPLRDHPEREAHAADNPGTRYPSNLQLSENDTGPSAWESLVQRVQPRMLFSYSATDDDLQAQHVVDPEIYEPLLGDHPTRNIPNSVVKRQFYVRKDYLPQLIVPGI